MDRMTRKDKIKLVLLIVIMLFVAAILFAIIAIALLGLTHYCRVGGTL